MDKSCFNCGDPAHYYIDCPHSYPVDRNFKKIANVVHRLNNPRVNFQSSNRYHERQRMYREAKLISVRQQLCT